MTILIIGLGILVFLLGVWLVKTFSDKINFFARGVDNKFSMQELSVLWKLSKIVGLEEPESLFISSAALEKCITHLIESSRRNGTEGSEETQSFLSKLYKFRTKVDIQSDRKRGLDSSRALDNGQKLRIVLKGSGIFASKILNNAREIIIPVPVQDGKVKIKGKDWEGKEISVYLWRKGDAGYVFDTKVLHAGIFLGQNVLYLAHSDDLFRSQKRKSVRSECHIPAQLYIIRERVTDFSKVETSPGYKCLIEDISSDGALIRTGGKGINNIQIKLQFELEDNLIVMYGLVRSVEFNSTNNQSRLHIEAMHIETSMRNLILAYVYKTMPDDQKTAAEAFDQLEDEEKSEAKEAQAQLQSQAQSGANAENVTKETQNTYSIKIPNTIIDADALSDIDEGGGTKNGDET